MHAITTLLFDLDGTLIDSVPDLALALNRTLSDNKLPTFAEDTVRHWVGNGARVLVQRGLSGNVTVSEEIAAQDDYVEAVLSQFLAHYSETLCSASRLYNGVYETLCKLKEDGYMMGLVTNKPEAFILPILQHYSLDNTFSVTVGGDTLSEKKPSAAPLLHACDALNVQPELCLMVGDSKNDILAAKAAQMKSIGLTYGYNYGEDVGVHSPEWICNHFSEVADIVRSQ